jgi:aryl-alcohol dehydrogenase-like predicted oxidoreductase
VNTSDVVAAAAGSFVLAGHVVHRLGFGAMRLTGPGVFGPPRDRAEALRVLRAAVDAGVNHIDTAFYYGPEVVNTLIREALYPYSEQLALVSKVGARRTPNGAILAWDEPADLRLGIENDLRSLRVERLAAVNLRVMDPGLSESRFDDQLEAMVRARDDGLIAGVGLSNVSLRQLHRALAHTEIVCVQNLFRLDARSSTAVLDECARRAIAFVPWGPLGPDETLNAGPIRRVATRHEASRAQVALAWVLAQGAHVLLIPGTSSPAHLRENLGAGRLTLTDADLTELESVADGTASQR